MSPLQRIAMGLVIVFVPAAFEIGGHAWDALPDPLGWVLVLSGLRGLADHLDLTVISWFAVAALVVSVPLWVPQFVEVLPHATVDGEEIVEPSIQWAFFLPQALFSLLLVRAIGLAAAARKPRDVFVAGRFGVLTWAFVAVIALPPVAYGARVDELVDPTVIGIAVVNLALIYYLFRVHRREWLAGPGPLMIEPRPRAAGNDEGRPPSS